jgi:hypothetical protein
LKEFDVLQALSAIAGCLNKKENTISYHA